MPQHAFVIGRRLGPAREMLPGGDLRAVPAKEPLEEQILGPDNAVDWLVRRVADGADRKCLGSGLWLAFKALILALDVDGHLQLAMQLASQVSTRVLLSFISQSLTGMAMLHRL